MYKPISLVSVKFIFETAIDLDKMYKKQTNKKRQQERNFLTQKDWH